MTSHALIAPIQAIVDLLHPVLVFFHDSVGVGWGMSIVLLTLCIRAVLTPLMVKQFKSMKAMIAYAPQIKAVQEKYKDDKERQRQEVMKVYQENKINPFASCLPILMQLPFFIGLFYLLGRGGPLREDICGQSKVECGDVESAMSGAEKFLFIPDLTATGSGTVLVALVVMYIGSQLLSSVLTPSTGDRNAKLLMYGLPFVFTFFIISFPTGLIVYWITTNLWTVGQGYILRKRLGPIRPPDADRDKDAPSLLKRAAGGDEGPRKGLMARLAEATAKQPVAAGAKSGGGNAKQPVAAGAKSGGGNAKQPVAAGAKSGGGNAKQPVAAGAKSGGRGSKGAASAPAPKAVRSGPPPPSPRKKKKRSGRRR